MDNYATHKTALIRNWLAAAPAMARPSDADQSSWLNQVERFFALFYR